MTLVDASHTPDQPTPPEVRDSEAGSAKIPLKARMSLYWQRIILTVRYWFRLPIDEIKEQHTQAQIDGLVALYQKQMDINATLSRVSNNMQQRLQFYETHIPRMRELKVQFDRELTQRQALGREAKESLDNGLLFVPSNGHRIVSS